MGLEGGKEIGREWWKVGGEEERLDSGFPSRSSVKRRCTDYWCCQKLFFYFCWQVCELPTVVLYHKLHDYFVFRRVCVEVSCRLMKDGKGAWWSAFCQKLQIRCFAGKWPIDLCTANQLLAESFFNGHGRSNSFHCLWLEQHWREGRGSWLPVSLKCYFFPSLPILLHPFLFVVTLPFLLLPPSLNKFDWKKTPM